MNVEVVQRFALDLCMKTGFRYLECLLPVVEEHRDALPKEYVVQVRRDYSTYWHAMTDALMKVNEVSLGRQE